MTRKPNRTTAKALSRRIEDIEDAEINVSKTQLYADLVAVASGSGNSQTRKRLEAAPDELLSELVSSAK